MTRRGWVYGAALMALLVGAQGARAEKPFDFATTPGKLPKDVRPSAYRIEIATDMDRLTFTGTEEVDVTVEKPTATITLNALGLAFQHVALKGEDGAAATVTVDEADQTATFRFPHPLTAGQHTLSIAYSGPIRLQPAGIYYADYDAGGAKKRMLVTQFEETDARRMVPSWDEPVFKSTYTLTATLPASFRGISNMPALKEEPAGPGLKKVSFAPSPKMSSYLLALVAGEMDRITSSADGTEIGVAMVSGKADQGRYGLDAASKILPFYNEYFGVKYPLPKLDLIAIPGNFAAGAMENWGAITYIDNALLFDPKSSSEGTRRAVFNVIAHEMAHQWSGDLVTMAWWDNIWLNEGFASWMATKATDKFNPDWKVWLQAHAETNRAMQDDARKTTHPVQQPIRDESEADSAFDDITYLKGQAVIRMIETYLGEDVFRDGMRHYMAAHAYSNTTTANLWDALAKASGKPVVEIAAEFTEQPGIPLVKVATSCVAGQTEARLTQDRFTVHDPNAAKLHWQVPVTLGRPGDGAVQKILLGATPETVRFPGCDQPVKANIGDVGYYRVQYDDADLKRLTAGFPALAPADRVNLLGDVWAMVQAGRVPVERYLDLTRQLRGETELAVWTQALGNLSEIDAAERGSPDRQAFRAYAIGLLRPVLARLGWNPAQTDTPDVLLLRSSLIRTLGRFGDADVQAEARKRFDAFLTAPGSLPPTLQDAVLRVVGYTADQKTWDQLRKLGKAADSTELRLRYYGALAGAGDPALIAQTVAITETDEISPGRMNRFIIGAAAASDNPDLVWKLFVPKRKKLYDTLPPQKATQLLPDMASASSDPAVADALLALPESQVSRGAKSDAARGAEEVRFNAEFRARLLPEVAKWLKTGITK